MLGARTPRLDLATTLLRDYRPESFFLSSPRGVLLADDPGYELASADAALAALAVAGPDAVLVGVLPFDRTGPARLGVSAAVRRAEPAGAAGFPRPAALDGIRWSRGEDNADGYRAAVSSALRRMAEGELDKVVLARSADLTADRVIPVAGLLAALAAGDPYAYIYAADLGDRTMVGASPELLVSQRNGTMVANPLAGSAPRDPHPGRDGRNATELLRSAKDRREHKVVVDAVADVLGPLCRSLDVPAEPELMRTGAMWHLSTRITGTPRDGLTALDLAQALHPTPAVCGHPTTLARAVIGELETVDRGFYSGMVGWTDTRGDGEWALAIRCAEVKGDALRLFAGAGVVAESTADGELAETEAKFGTLLRALGVAR
ncbi:isochorismate synthase [Amycolatopsis pithecellobii]|uniref:isochorismate synthase n=1 Tax=Amycolatopsis pithecellobii TaxID=664692 RepID=UPI0012B6F9E7|nr:isochorismate synthase [Amycolatopsis pithecellobii]